MVDNAPRQTPLRRLHVFLCHDLRDKKETKNEAGQPTKGIVLQLSEWLEAHDIEVWRSDKELAGGETWKREIYDKAIPTCDLFVVCLTKHFIDDIPGQRHREVTKALEIAETKHPDTTFILPVRLEQVHYPGLGEKQYINFYKHLNFDILLPTLEKKRNQIGNQGNIPGQTMPSHDDPSLSSRKELIGVWNVPYKRNPYFTGRDDLLDRLEQQLASATQNAPIATRSAALIQPQAIKGLGGIGKTQIAVEYAYRSRNKGDYTHTFWINAASEDAIITSFMTIAEMLPSLSAKNEIDQRKLIEAVKRWLEQCQQRWLLIFDNADDLALVQNYLPSRGTNGSILLTTRADAVGALATPIEVATMGFVEGTQLLLRRAQRFENASDEEFNQAGNIVIELDHFPLALDQAGAYIEETGCSFVHYLQVYNTHGKELLTRRGGLKTIDYPASVMTTWSLSFQKVEQANPAAADLLRLCAFLAPDTIPEELITSGAPHWSSPLQQAAADLFIFNQMIEELLKFSLIQRLAETQILRIHRLVQAVQMDTIEPEVQRQWAERVIRALDSVFPNDIGDVATWPQCLRYLDQAQISCALIEQYGFSFAEAVELLYRTGTYLYQHAFYALAEPLYVRALHIREQSLGPEHPQVAYPLNGLADLYRKQGKYAEAEPLYQRALRIRELSLGPDHPDVASPLNNLAILYKKQGKYAEAEPLYQRALRIRELNLGPEHPDVAYPLNGLADLYREQGKDAEAEPLYQRALRIRELSLGPDHPDVASPLNNLAILYKKQGKYAEAEPLFQRALRIFELSLGPEHPDVASPLNNLANLYAEQGKFAEAEALFQRALRIFELNLGPEHPDVAYPLNNLADLYREQGKDAEAEPLYQRALRIRELSLGPDHPLVASPLNGLADLYRDQGKDAEAEPLYLRALRIRELSLGPEHPDVAYPLNGLADLYREQGKFAEAEPLYLRALRIRELSLGPDHALTQQVRENYALLLRTMGRDGDAKKLEEES